MGNLIFSYLVNYINRHDGMQILFVATVGEISSNANFELSQAVGTQSVSFLTNISHTLYESFHDRHHVSRYSADGILKCFLRYVRERFLNMFDYFRQLLYISQQKNLYRHQGISNALFPTDHQTGSRCPVPDF